MTPRRTIPAKRELSCMAAKKAVRQPLHKAGINKRLFYREKQNCFALLSARKSRASIERSRTVLLHRAP